MTPEDRVREQPPSDFPTEGLNCAAHWTPGEQPPTREGM